MCGIVGLYLKNPKLENEIGKLFEPMMEAMTNRGPDSAGFAIYGDEVATGVKLTLQHDNVDYPWHELQGELSETYGSEVSLDIHSTAVVLKINANEEDVRSFIEASHPEVSVMSVGKSIEILKGMGLPVDVTDRFNLKGMKGTHIIGHTRMATESAVTTEGSHPFSTGMDLCLAHNGSLSNHNRLREELKREGIKFQTENDSEVAAGYLAWRLREGDSLKQALESGLEALDGFYTFVIGTQNGFAVIRDPVACKPAIMAETEDYVAFASEYHALADLPGIENAKLWEPEPATVYTWGSDAA
jgi:methylamine---glutamate N-methyltransferase subunit A